MLEDSAGVSVPEPLRSLSVSDQELLMVLYPQLAWESRWLVELRFLEDRCDGVKAPPVAVRFSRDIQELVTHLKAHRELAAQRARQLREFGTGPYPAALFFGVQPRGARRGRKEHVAAFVALTCDLDCKDWPELAEGERPRAIWELLHTVAPSPSLVAWTGHGFHAYWLLREPLLDKSRGEEVQKAIACALRGDHVADCSRLLRWFNSVNYKGLHSSGCRTVRLVSWRPELRYAFRTLADHFLPFAQAREAPRREGSPGARVVWKRFYACIDRDSGLKALWQGLPGGLNTTDRSRLDMALAHALVRHALSFAAFQLIAPLAPWNGQKTLPPAYLERTWSKAQVREVRPVIPASEPPRDPETQPDQRAREVSSPPAVPACPPLPPDLAEGVFLSSLPESAWTPWARLYRDAVGSSTEAADELHYVALLAVLGAVLGRTVWVPSGLPLHPNVYAMLIGPTGDRKSTAAQLALALLRQVAPEVLVLDGLGSQEGLMERMAEADLGQALHSRTLLFVDEVAALLKKGRRESSGSLIEFVTELFHGPASKNHYTRSKAVFLKNPTLSILAASTPAWLEAALEEEDIMGGFTNRFVYVTAPSKPDNPTPALPDACKLQELANWIRKATRGPARSLDWAPAGRDLWCDFYRDWRRFLADLDERSAALLRRIDNYILKFASISAAMDEATLITAEHLTGAIDLGRFLAGCCHRVLGELGTPKDCRLERLVEQKLLAAQGSMRRKHLRQLLGGRITGEKLDRILRAMERNGLVRLVDEHTSRGLSRLVALTSSAD